MAQSISALGGVQLASLAMESLPRKGLFKSHALNAQVASAVMSHGNVGNWSFLYKLLLPMVLKDVSIYLSCAQNSPNFNGMIIFYISRHDTFNSPGKHIAPTSQDAPRKKIQMALQSRGERLSVFLLPFLRLEVTQGRTLQFS